VSLDSLAKLFAAPLDWFYSLVHSYGLAIALITVAVMLILTPLNLKQTKSMLEMQLLQPQLKKLQQEHRGDRQTLNAEMMKLYQEHKVNPLASCLPLLAQMPVFIGMFRLLRGLTSERATDGTEFFLPKFVKKSSELYQDLSKSKEMLSWGLDLARTPVSVMKESFGKGLIYALLVALLGVLYWVQQRMVASRNVSPTMSQGQQKLMQYLPVAFAPIQLFFPTGLVIYYLFQTVLRIAQAQYITQRFYKGENSLGTRAGDAGKEARELGKADKDAKADPNAKPGRPSFKSTVTDLSKAQTPKPVRPQPSRPQPSKPQPAKPVKPANPKAVTPPKGAATPADPRSNRPATPDKAKPTGSRHPKPKKK
jgi:YidC/Oxa1 family membrane protein insertase